MKACQQLDEHDSAVGTVDAVTENIPSPLLWPIHGQSGQVDHGVKSDAVIQSEYLGNIFNNLPVAVITLDNHGYVRFCNDMAMQFFNVSVIGQLWRSVIEQCFLQQENTDELVLSSGRIVRLETSPLDNKCGQVLIFSDVTKDRDLKNIRDRYSRLSELGEMAASLAHQIRTPLAASMLFFSNIRKFLDTTTTSYASLEKGMTGLRHIESMIEDMLLFSKGGKKGDDKLSISDLVEELKQDAYLLTQEYNCVIDIHDRTGNKSISVNRHAIKAAISNLVVNAAQACKSRSDGCHESEYRGKVEVIIKELDYGSTVSSICIQVHDNGVGISKEQQADIKEPFYTTKPNGTGLGLAVTKLVVDSHAGEMEINSSVMTGTEICINLP